MYRSSIRVAEYRVYHITSHDIIVPPAKMASLEIAHAMAHLCHLISQTNIAGCPLVILYSISANSPSKQQGRQSLEQWVVWTGSSLPHIMGGGLGNCRRKPRSYMAHGIFFATWPWLFPCTVRVPKRWHMLGNSRPDLAFFILSIVGNPMCHVPVSVSVVVWLL